MKKIILFLLIGLGAWNYYSKNADSPQSVSPTPISLTKQHVEKPYKQSAVSFTCDGRQHCSQMNSRAEAVFFINNCPNTKMDGDRDGVPCENDSRF